MLTGDATEQDRVASEREERVGLFDTIFHAVEDPILLMDYGRVTRWPIVVDTNHAFMSLTGFVKSDIVGQSITSLISDASATSLEALLVDNPGAPSQSTVRVAIRTSGNGYRNAFLQFKKVGLENGGARFAGIFHDSPLDRLAGDQPFGDVREVEELEEARLYARVNHELRTPLNAILGFADIMKDELLGEHAVGTYKEYSAGIHAAGRELLGHVDDLLMLRRYADPDPGPADSLVCLEAVVEECASSRSDLARRGNVEIQIHKEEGVPKVHGNSEVLRDFVRALVGNAVAAAPPGTAVGVRLIGCADQPVELHVTDAGVGLTGDEVQAFFSTAADDSGIWGPAIGRTSVGLPVMRRLLGVIGADMHFDRRIDGTSVMRIRFPEHRSAGSD